jgi:rhodanese-related sulfurtransferase
MQLWFQSGTETTRYNNFKNKKEVTMANKTQERLKTIIELDKEKENLGMVSLHQTRELIMDAGAILLDVRPPAKVTGENAQEAGIQNAYYTPYPEFADYLDILPSDHTTPIVVACLKGWFANRVMGYLEMMGYENVYVMDTSIEDLIEVHKAHTAG